MLVCNDLSVLADHNWPTLNLGVNAVQNASGHICSEMTETQS